VAGRMMPLKVVHLITELNVGGAEQMLHKLTGTMDPVEFQSNVVSMTDVGPIGERIQAQGTAVYSLGMRLGKPNPLAFFRLYHILKRIRPDVLQTWLYHADLLGLVAGRLAGIGRIVWGVRCSDMDLKDYSPMTRWVVRANALLSPLPDAIVVNSEKGKRVHAELGYATGKMCLIPNGFDLNRFQPSDEARKSVLSELNLTQEAVLVGLVARHDPMKDHETFLMAASMVAEKESPVHFLLIGKGIEAGNRRITKFIREGQQDRFHLLGVREDMPRWTAALDIAVSASAYGEGFSNTVGEAMASGVPCVVTDVGDNARIVGGAGLVVPPGEPEALAQALIRLVDLGKEERKKMGDRARRQMAAEFEIGHVARRFEALYRQSAAGCRP